jgi:DnaJ-class molecular chaperone
MKRIRRKPAAVHDEAAADMTMCPECNGEGIVYGSYDAATDHRHYLIMGACPICEGRGTVHKRQGEDMR